MLLCAPCWHSVPRELQARVWRTWRAVQKLRPPQDEGEFADHGLVRREYQDAAAAAIAAAKERAVQKVLPA